MSRKFKIALFLIILFGVWILFAPFLANILIVEKPLERAEAIWVLGGSSTYIERNQKAAELYKKGIAPKIFVVNDGVFSGWNQAEQRNLPIYELSKRELMAQGVPEQSIEILSKVVEGTSYEAQLFAETAQERRLKSVLLITSAYHSRRTLWTFQKTVLKDNLSIEIGLQSPPTGQQTPPPFIWWLSRKGWTTVGGEYVKMPYYWLFY
jgi:uncharacterized SAM-binding protein YcdF (DUF218 family)